MIRAVVLAEERRWMLLVAVFATTLFLGFGVQAAGSLYLRWAESPIVTHYRTTLSYTSAIVGDAFLIPLVNVFVTSQLWEWRRRPGSRDVGAALFGGAFLTIAVHLYQAANDLLNWTMLAPYRWTALGYFHAMFMFSELSFVLFFWGQVGLVAREQPRAIFSRKILFVILCSLVFLRLLLGDYGYFA